jgi:hypothetical protein
MGTVGTTIVQIIAIHIPKRKTGIQGIIVDSLRLALV